MIRALLLLAYLLLPLGAALWVARRDARRQAALERLGESAGRLLVGAGFTGVRWRVSRVALRPGQLVTEADLEPEPWHELGEQPRRKEGA